MRCRAAWGLEGERRLRAVAGMGGTLHWPHPSQRGGGLRGISFRPGLEIYS